MKTLTPEESYRKIQSNHGKKGGAKTRLRGSKFYSKISKDRWRKSKKIA